MALVERWRAAHHGSYVDELNRTAVDMAGRVRDFDVSDLRTLAGRGHQSTMTVGLAEFQAVITVDPPGGFSGSTQPATFPSAFSGTQLTDVEDAFTEGRWPDFLRLCADLECQIHINLQVVPEVAGFNWIRTADALITPIEQRTWLDTIQGLFRAGSVVELVVESAGDSWLSAAGLSILGPTAQPHQPSGYDSGPWDAYRKAWLADDRTAIPPPIAIYPSSHNGLDAVDEYLKRAAHAICWIWLATSASISASRVGLTFEHGAYLEVDFSKLPPADGTEATFALAEWSTASADYMRQDAVEHAIALVVGDPATLVGSARRVLNTAKLLLQLAQSGAIAEALASRRAAIQAAVDAARTTSEAARSAARSSSDRVFAEVAVAVGIVLTNAGSLINVVTAHDLILVVAALGVATGLSAYLFEYPSAAHTLESFEADLRAHGDALTRDDIADIKSMESLKRAKDDVWRAKLNTGALLLVVFAAAVIGWFVVK